MSQLKQRAEKDCLNCGAEINGRFCSECGQENLEITTSAWHLIVHFFNDFTHFDGKFFSTLGFMIKKPGFLSLEYMKGRRKRYLDPVRMYIFTSFVFFLIFYSFAAYSPESTTFKYNGKSESEIELMDSASFHDYTKTINNGDPMSREAFKKYFDSVNQHATLDLFNAYKSQHEYDSLLAAGKIKQDWLERKLASKQFEVQKKFRNNKDAFLESLWGSITHSFPQLFFISLPLFALCLKLMYLRHKAYTYVPHAVYALHLYIFTFFAGMLSMFISWLGDVFHSEELGLVNIFIFIGLIVYEFFAMRRFYRQGRLKTFVKFSILVFMRFFILVFLFIIFILLSFFKV